MPNAPEVSILIVTHGNPDLTSQCLTSIRDHVSGVSYETLALDSASPDDTPQVIEDQFDWVSLEALVENVGFARGNNQLAARAHGNYLLMCNPDVMLHDDAVSALVDFAERHPEGGLWGARTVTPSGDLDPSSCWGEMTMWSLVCFATGLSTAFPRSPKWNPEGLGGWDRGDEREVGVVTGCFTLVRRDLWHELGGLDERFWMYGEDADLTRRARLAGYTPMVTPRATVTHVVGASSRPQSKVVWLLRGKVTLLGKHRSRVGAFFGRALLTLGVALRALLARPDRKRAGRLAAGWPYAWTHRRSWQRPYSLPAFSREDS